MSVKFTWRQCVVAALVVLTLGGHGSLHAAEGPGVHFEEALSWQQIQEKARKENKHIFVDMVATWCAPCKLMDNFTYPEPQVGSALNAHFISVKVQVDVTDKDTAQVKSWYEDAARLKDEFNVTAVPTFLFFTPGGKIVHRGSGQKNAQQMIELAQAALNPEKQVYTQLERYRSAKAPGALDHERLFQLALAAKEAGDAALSATLTRQYITDYLLKKDPATLTERDIALIAQKTLTSKDPGFALLGNPSSAAIIDRILKRPGYTQTTVDWIVRNEEITPKMSKTGPEPDWAEITAVLTRKYDAARAERVVIDGRYRWHYERQEWKQFWHWYALKLGKYGIGTGTMDRAQTNEVMFNVIFPKIDDPEILAEAAAWMEKVVKVNADDPGMPLSGRATALDTYAQLLYKAGKKDEAIAAQQQAVELEATEARQNKTQPRPEFAQVLGKMQRGESLL
jgi:thiol-disulfide isomerase/thioredoxin